MNVGVRFLKSIANAPKCNVVTDLTWYHDILVWECKLKSISRKRIFIIYFTWQRAHCDNFLYCKKFEHVQVMRGFFIGYFLSE